MTTTPTGWRPIETAKPGERVLLWHPLWMSALVGEYAGVDRTAYIVGYPGTPFIAFQWQPLPEPPQ